MIAEGGMGTVSRIFAEAARAAGARSSRSTRRSAVTVDGGAASGVVLADGRVGAAAGGARRCDPYRLMRPRPGRGAAVRADHAHGRGAAAPARR